jgi:hypothetical protein
LQRSKSVRSPLPVDLLLEHSAAVAQKVFPHRSMHPALGHGAGEATKQ